MRLQRAEARKRAQLEVLYRRRSVMAWRNSCRARGCLPVVFEGSGEPVEWGGLLQRGIVESMVEQDIEELMRVEDIRLWCEVSECKDSEPDMFITAEDVEVQVNEMAKGKAPGPDGLTAKVRFAS